MRSREVAAADLKAGDTLVLGDRGFRVTEITPYDGEQCMRDLGAFGIAHVEGYGEFMSLWKRDTVRVAA